MTFYLRRTAETERSTRGDICGPDGAHICFALERGARNPDHVRIPAGTYVVSRKPIGASEFDHSLKLLMPNEYKGILWLPEVTARSNIEIHPANWIDELLGCIATGMSIAEDTSGDFMAVFSKDAYAKLYPLISRAIDNGGAQIVITNIPS